MKKNVKECWNGCMDERDGFILFSSENKGHSDSIIDQTSGF